MPHPAELVSIPEALLDGGALLWLDDVEQYLIHGLDRARLHNLLDKTVVVATLRREQLQKFMPFQGTRSPAWELLNDSSIVIQFHLSGEWTSEEQERLRQAVSSEVVIQGVAETGGLGEYLSAGPE